MLHLLGVWVISVSVSMKAYFPSDFFHFSSNPVTVIDVIMNSANLHELTMIILDFHLAAFKRGIARVLGDGKGEHSNNTQC